jgi:hypothetical protein
MVTVADMRSMYNLDVEVDSHSTVVPVVGNDPGDGLVLLKAIQFY